MSAPERPHRVRERREEVGGDLEEGVAEVEALEARQIPHLPPPQHLSAPEEEHRRVGGGAVPGPRGAQRPLGGWRSG
eukprot:1269973-Rhodomonas_salina.2